MSGNSNGMFSISVAGLRPERLKKFDADCWALMEQCWHVEPEKRPWPGEVEPTIHAVMERYLLDARSSLPSRDRNTSPPSDTDTLASSPYLAD